MESVAVCADWTQDMTGSLVCSSPIALVPLDGLVTVFDVAQLNPEALAAHFGAGFVLVGTLLVAGAGIKALKQAVRNG